MRIAGSIVITGASSGIGKACALRLDQLGFQVFAGVRREADGEALRREASDRLTPLVIDVTDTASIAAAVVAVTDATADLGIGALINNAGIAVAGPLEFLPLADLRQQFEVNVIGQIAVTQAFLGLVRRGKGRIINMGSTSGRSVLPFAGAYGASKHALRALTVALRMELQPWGIPVTSIEPSTVATPIWARSVAASEERERISSAQERERYGHAQTIVNRAAGEQTSVGTPVATVVAVVVRAVTARRPRTVYSVGRNARLRVFVELLPGGLRDRIIMRRVLRGN
ncbi:MAG: SDR family NAD(P)-dependent oxidoreductase [Chloroflexota bacterium]|nr:SDR family NAD(P)-dependent oxidoreductase [Chloroflexota bacterium]MDQ6906369.1 SDR family NAD(P)-dependent oxidoreductase [Chloroflexota bacterium]